jgi:hypothetical protein
MSEVYIVTENVNYEGTDIRSVHGNRDDATQAAGRYTEEHRYSGEWDQWRTGGDHVISLRLRDVTFVVSRYEVQ